jgi:hypothetical protein
VNFGAKCVVAVVVSGVGSILAWWVCERPLKLDEAATWGITTAVLAVLLTATGWWVAREKPEGSAGTRRFLIQKGKAGRDLNIVGGSQTIINEPRRER